MSETSGEHVVHKRIGRLFYCLIVAATIATLLLLTVLSGWATTIFFPDTRVENISTITWSANAPEMVWGLAWLIVDIVGVFYVYRSCSRWSERRTLTAILIVTTVLSAALIMIAHTGTHLFNDARSLIAYATMAAAGDWSTFQPGAAAISQNVPSAYQYFIYYPYQIGCFLFFYLIFNLFGAGNVLALELCGVLANEVAIAALTGIAWKLLPSHEGRIVAPVMIGMNIPFLLLAAFPYGNAAGFSLACIYLYLQVRSIQGDKKEKKSLLFQLLSLVPLACCLIVKSTYQLVALAVCLAWFVMALRDNRWIELLSSVLVLILALVLAGVPKTCFEQKMGIDYGDGLPTVSWIEIGLTDSFVLNDQPGWWDGEALDEWNRTGGDAEETKEYLTENMKNRVAVFLDDPGYLLSFIRAKLVSEWAEPTYQSVMYYGLNEDLGGNGTHLWILDDPVATHFFDGLQSFIYCGAFVGALRLFKERKRDKGVGLALCCSVMAGFTCYLVWEAKSVYVMPFVTLMIPLGAYGYDWLFSRLGQRGALVASEGRYIPSHMA